jgi:hypothetical protein
MIQPVESLEITVLVDNGTDSLSTNPGFVETLLGALPHNLVERAASVELLPEAGHLTVDIDLWILKAEYRSLVHGVAQQPRASAPVASREDFCGWYVAGRRLIPKSSKHKI